MAQTGTARNMLNPLLANAYSKKVTLFIMDSFRKSIGAKTVMHESLLWGEDVPLRHHCNLCSKLLRNFILGEQFIELSHRLKVSNGESLCVIELAV